MPDTKGKVIKCKAAVAWKPGEPFVIETIEVSPPKAKEVRIKLSFTGLCRTDVTAWMGKVPKKCTFPVIVGHEGAGIVESTGEDVTSVSEGDHVITFPINHCQECALCKSDETNACLRYFKKPGMQGVMPDGTIRYSCRGQKIHHYLGSSTFSEYIVTEDCQITKVNKNAPMDKICLLSCGVTTGFGAAVNTAKVKPGTICVVIGLGTVGLAAVMGCKYLGAARIIGVDVNNSKKDIAKKFGLTEFYNLNELEKPLDEVLTEKTGGGCHYAFECSGNTAMMEAAFNTCLLAIGKCIIIGIPGNDQTFRVDPYKLVFGRKVLGTLTGGYTLKELPQLVEKYMEKKIMLDEFITSISPIEEVNESIANMGKEGSIKHVLRF